MEPVLVDVTDKVGIGEIDDELTYLDRCVCGARFKEWDFVISIYAN